MQITLPDAPNLAAMFLLGKRMHGGAVQEIGSILVKALYRLEPTSGSDDTHQLIPADSPPEIVLADKGPPPPPPPWPDGFDVEREADIAPYKDRADIVVEGYLPEDFKPDVDPIQDPGGMVKVDGATWLTRRAEPLLIGLDPLPRADRNRHLFGYQPRTEAPREGEKGTLDRVYPQPIPPGVQPLATLDDFVDYDNRFLNFHRRGQGYDVAVGVDLPPGTRVEVFQTANVTAGTDPDLAVTLPHSPLTARYRAYCGHGPDRPTRWSIIRLGTMRVDTLILKPDPAELEAEVLYRTVWPWSDQPAEHYRAIQIQEDTV